MLPKKKIIELSKKKVEEELQKQKEVLEERSPFEKAKQAYKEEVVGTSPETDEKGELEKSEEKPSTKSESVPKKKPLTKASDATTADLSKIVDRSYEQLQRTTKGIGAAASVFLGESLGVDTADDSENSDTDSKPDAAALARKILERTKRKKSDE